MSDSNLRLIAIVQGVACVLIIAATGIAFHSLLACLLAIFSLAFGFLSTSCMLIDDSLFWEANLLTIGAILFAAAAVTVML